MIRKLIRQMLTAQVFSALTVSLCLLIDSVMIGRFLGVEAIAAYQLANPILLVIGAVGSMFLAYWALHRSTFNLLQKMLDSMNENFNATIDFSVCKNCGTCAEKCPRKTIVKQY